MPLSCLEITVSMAGWPTVEPFSHVNKVCLSFLSGSKFKLGLISPTCHSNKHIPVTDLTICPIDSKHFKCLPSEYIRKNKIKYKESYNNGKGREKGAGRNK